MHNVQRPASGESHECVDLLYRQNPCVGHASDGPTKLLHNVQCPASGELHGSIMEGVGMEEDVGSSRGRSSSSSSSCLKFMFVFPDSFSLFFFEILICVW